MTLMLKLMSRVCRKKEKYLDIYTKVIPASRGSGVLDNLDIETTPLACASQGYLKACQGESIMLINGLHAEVEEVISLVTLHHVATTLERAYIHRILY